MCEFEKRAGLAAQVETWEGETAVWEGLRFRSASGENESTSLASIKY